MTNPNPSPEPTDLEALKREAPLLLEELEKVAEQHGAVSVEHLAITFIRRLLDAVEGLEKERTYWKGRAEAEWLQADKRLNTRLRLEAELAQERQKTAALREVLEAKAPWTEVDAYPGDWDEPMRLEWYQDAWSKALAKLTEAPYRSE